MPSEGGRTPADELDQRRGGDLEPAGRASCRAPTRSSRRCCAWRSSCATCRGAASARSSTWRCGPLQALQSRDLREEVQHLPGHANRLLGSLDKATIMVTQVRRARALGAPPRRRRADRRARGRRRHHRADRERAGHLGAAPGPLVRLPQGPAGTARTRSPAMVALHATPLGGGEHSWADDPRTAGALSGKQQGKERLHDRTAPGIQLYQLGTGHYVSRAMYLAAKLDLAGHIARGARDFRALAQWPSDTDAPSPAACCGCSPASGSSRSATDGEFRADRARRTSCATTRRARCAASVMLFTGPRIQEGWGEPEYCVRTGEPAYRKLHPDDADAFTSISRDPAARRDLRQSDGHLRAADLRGDRGRLRLRPVRECSPTSAAATARLMIGILRANPKLRGLVFDQPHVIERARAHVASAGFADRCELSAAASSRSCRAAPTRTC